MRTGTSEPVGSHTVAMPLRRFRFRNLPGRPGAGGSCREILVIGKAVAGAEGRLEAEPGRRAPSVKIQPGAGTDSLSIVGGVRGDRGARSASITRPVCNGRTTVPRSPRTPPTMLRAVVPRQAGFHGRALAAQAQLPICLPPPPPLLPMTRISAALSPPAPGRPGKLRNRKSPEAASPPYGAHRFAWCRSA